MTQSFTQQVTFYTEDHEWVTVHGDLATVGITRYAAEQLGDVVFVEVPEVGKTFKKGDEMAVVESVKAASDVYAPLSGEVIDAKPVNVSEVGQRTQVSIRPERVEYNSERLQKGAHTLKAEVLEFIYMGDIFRTRLRVAGNEDFIIKTRNAPDQVKLKPGEQIEIGWLPEDCRALD